MPKKITYGVSGLIDWTAVIPVGKARLRVHFTGGAITKYGVTPAEFTTCDRLTQSIIEGSDYYRRGKITTLRSVGHHEVLPLSRKNGVEAQQAFVSSVLPMEQAEEAPAENPSVQVVTVACIEDAIEYMREHYGEPSVRMRNVEALQTVAKQYGITFDIQS